MDRNRWPRIRRRSLVGLIALIVAAAGWPVLAPTAQDQAQNQSLDEIFTRVSPTVVVVRSKGRDVGVLRCLRRYTIGRGDLHIGPA